MTSPTDEELDALVQMLQQRNKSKHGYTGHPLYNRNGLQAADAITALRAQIARREEMHDCAMKERDDATLYADEQKARADRAEAALGKEREDRANDQKSFLENFAKLADETLAERAAQIDADAGIAYEVAHNTNDISKIRDAIRNQPHDRTALDRMLAEMRVGALSEAADLGDTSCNNGGLAKSPAHFLKMEEHAWYRKSCEDYSAAILALLDKEGA